VVISSIRIRSWEIQNIGYADGDVVGDAVELDQNILLDDGGHEMREFEADGVDEELLLDWE